MKGALGKVIAPSAHPESTSEQDSPSSGEPRFKSVATSSAEVSLTDLWIAEDRGKENSSKEISKVLANAILLSS